MDNEGNSTISEELDFETQIAEIWDYINQTEVARNADLDIDEEGLLASLRRARYLLKIVLNLNR